MQRRTPIPRLPFITLKAALALPLLTVLGCVDAGPPTSLYETQKPKTPLADIID